MLQYVTLQRANRIPIISIMAIIIFIIIITNIRMIIIVASDASPRDTSESNSIGKRAGRGSPTMIMKVVRMMTMKVVRMMMMKVMIT